MPLDPDRVEAITFDSYSTIVDVDAVERALRARVSDTDPERVSNLWRSRSLMYAMVGNFIDEYAPFYELNRAALSYALAFYDCDVGPDEQEEILATYHELDVFEDVREGMARLRDAGYDLYVVSNGNPEMLESMVTHADIGDLLTDTVSADEVRTYKPAAEFYRHAAARTGTPVDRLVHVSAAWWDVLGAQHAGTGGVWVDRKGTPPEPFGPDPDLTVETFHELVDHLGD